MNFKYRVRSNFFILFLHVPVPDNSADKLQQFRPTERAACISISQVTPFSGSSEKELRISLDLPGILDLTLGLSEQFSSFKTVFLALRNISEELG